MERKDIDSLRLGGMKVDQLPIGERARTLPQLEKVEENQTYREAEGIRAQYPKHSVNYCLAGIKEAKNNQIKITQMRDKAIQDIASYKTYISQCEYRDKQLKTETDPERIKQLKIDFPPYNVEAMDTQIGQFEDTVKSCDSVIKQEIESVRVFAGLQTLCEQRDKKLKALGV